MLRGRGARFVRIRAESASGGAPKRVRCCVGGEASRTRPLLRLESLHRVDPGRPSRRHQTRHDANRDETGRHQAVRRGIGWLHLV